MRIIYECEKLVILQEDDKILVHVLDNYRFVKEIKTNSKNLLSILRNEFPNTKFKEKVVFGKKILNSFNKGIDAEMLLKLVWMQEEE